MAKRSLTISNISSQANTDDYREALSQRFYGISADEFRRRYKTGRYEHVLNKETLNTLLIWFPDLKD